MRKLPSGRFQARYQGPDGLLRSAPETFPSQTDANRWLVRKEAEILDGRWKNPDDKVLFGVYAAAWFKERDYAATTRERNGSALGLHILPTFENVVLSEITTPQIRRWRAGLLESGIGEPTIAKAYQILRAIMNTAVDDEVIQRNPCRIKGAGAAKTAERPFLDVSEVFQLATPCRPASGCSSSWPPSPASVLGNWPGSSAMTSTSSGEPSLYDVLWPRPVRTASW